MKEELKFWNYLLYSKFLVFCRCLKILKLGHLFSLVFFFSSLLFAFGSFHYLLVFGNSSSFMYEEEFQTCWKLVKKLYTSHYDKIGSTLRFGTTLKEGELPKNFFFASFMWRKQTKERKMEKSFSREEKLQILYTVATWDRRAVSPFTQQVFLTIDCKSDTIILDYMSCV